MFLVTKHSTVYLQIQLWFGFQIIYYKYFSVSWMLVLKHFIREWSAKELRMLLVEFLQFLLLFRSSFEF
jgi:hypothetical protein